MNAINQLFDYDRTTRLLQSVAGRNGWDQETMMPTKSGNSRAMEMGALEEVIHDRKKNAKVKDLLEKSVPETPHQKRAYELIKRDFDRAEAIPSKLASDIATTTSLAQMSWQTARRNNDFSEFSPHLKRVIKLKRDEAALLSPSGDLYDGLINDYEFGMTKREASSIFAAMKPRLLDLRQRISQSKLSKPVLKGDFNTEKQLKLAHKVAKTFFYDFNRGRIDTVAHPFCSGSGDDVRITTRVDNKDPFNCLYSTIHEVGHACYEQNVSTDFLHSPLGSGVSLGIHESQSRIFENQIGRSRHFTKWLFKEMKNCFGEFGIGDPEEFYRLVNKVETSFIRTEADEVHYNLHIMLRFELEVEVIAKNLEVEDLPEAWNKKFKDYFGRDVTKPSDGILQDVHWSIGAFGYFPTYTLGNLNAGCLFEKMKEDIPNMDERFEKGDVSSATNWLTENIHQHGSVYEPSELIKNATGEELTPEPFLNYLDEKFSDMYEV